MRQYKGIFYFKHYEDARKYAVEGGWPTDRLIWYQRGWAIQLYRSGPYVGPEEIKAKEQGQYISNYGEGLTRIN